MELEYNLFFEMAAIPLDIVICLFIFIRHKKNTPTNVALKRFAVLDFETPEKLGDIIQGYDSLGFLLGKH